MFIQACEGKQRIVMLFVIHTIAKRKTKHLSIFDHPSNYEKKKKSKEKSLRYVHLEKIKIFKHVRLSI